MSWRAFTHHTLRTLLRTIQIVAFVVIPGVLLWLQVIGLPHPFFKPLMEAAAREGLALGFTRMRLSLMEGLVLDHVELRAMQLPKNNEVAIDRVAVSLNWRQALRGKVELNALDLQGAQLFLPVENTHVLRLTQARARLILANGVVSVPFAQFNLQGINIVASGQVLLSEPLQPSPGESPSPSSPPPLRAALPPEVGQILDVLESFNFGSEPPTLEVEFAAKAGHLDEIRMPRIELQARQAIYGAIHLQDVQLNASYDASILNIRKLEAHDNRGGKLAALGQWNIKSKDVRFDLESSLTPVPWLRQFYPQGPWADLILSAHMDIRATLEVASNPVRHLQLRGSLASGPFEFRGTTFGGISGDFAWRDGSIYASNTELLLPKGKIQADFMMQPDDVRIRLDCLGDPTPLTVFLNEKARADLHKMELRFEDPPEIHFEASGSKLDPAALSGHGTLKLGHTVIHDSSMDHATADLHYEGLALTLSNIKAYRPEGSANGAFTYDFGRNQVRLDNIRSTMTPFNVLQWADPSVAAETKPYRFKAPPDVTVNGVIWLKSPTQTQITANFKAEGGLDYDLLDRTLNFGSTTGALKVNGRKIDLKIPSAQLFGGSVKLEAAISTDPPNARQNIALSLKQVDFTTLTRLYFGYQDSGGSLSGRYDFSFVANKPRLMRGAGNLLIQNGKIFAIPVLGPISPVLNLAIPGAGYQTARRATCDFRVADGEIRTDNLNIIATGFSMIGQGSLFFVDDRMDFAVRVNAQGIPGALLYPVSKLMEYISDGKMSEPLWRPRNLPWGGRTKPAAAKKAKDET